MMDQKERLFFEKNGIEDLFDVCVKHGFEIKPSPSRTNIHISKNVMFNAFLTRDLFDLSWIVKTQNFMKLESSEARYPEDTTFEEIVLKLKELA